MKCVRSFRRPFTVLLVCVSSLGAVGQMEAGECRIASGHVPEMVRHLKPVGALADETPLRLAVGLRLRNTAGLSNLLTELYRPGSLAYHQFLTPQEFTARFGPTESDYQTVINFARTNHLSITGTYSNRMLLDVTGRAADIEAALHIRLRTYHQPTENRDFYAPDSEPTVSQEIPILDFTGLSNFRLPHPQIHSIAAADKSWSAPKSGSASGGSYLGNDIRAAYLPGVTLNGAGQSVGLVEFDGFYTNDIARYETLGGLPQVPLQTILLDGFKGTPSASSGNSEVSLDIEMLVAIAPGLSNIVVFEAGPDGNPNDVLNAMAADNQVKQFSCSWGWSGGPSATTDQIFQQMAAQGQSFYCASGDNDAYPAGTVDSPSQQNSPSDDPYITIVGATTLSTTGPGGAWLAETVWNWGDGTGSGGGTSSYYSIPSWQEGLATSINGASASMRNFPDVACVGDNIYVTYNNGESGVFGGTSCAAPLWAGINAHINQQLLAFGQPAIGFVNPAIYFIAQSSDYPGAFHDITTGNNTSSSSPTEFYAEPGFDLCTGWGTPNAKGLIGALTAPLDPLVISQTEAFAPAGLAGGPFTVQSQTVTLTNTGATPLNWSVASTPAWLNVFPQSGTLPPGGDSSFIISLTTSAGNLPVGAYSASVWITNLLTGFAQSRPCTLQILSQLVQNGGFEAGSFAGWTESGNLSYTSVTTATTYVHSGTHGAELGPSGSLGYLTQNLPTAPGQPYLLSLWLNVPKSGTPNEFKISWNSSVVYDHVNLPSTGWTNLQFVVSAANATSILQFGFRDDPAYLGLDDVSLLPIGPALFQSLSRLNSSVRLSCQTIAGAVYQIQYKTNINQSAWQNLGQPFAATSSNSVIIDSTATDPQRFYRIAVVH